MPFWRLYYHLVWSTRDREALITPEVETRLYPYLVHKASELDVYLYAVNGWHDHIHVIVAIPPKHSVAEVVKHLKGASSYDMNHAGGLGGAFAWQRGYGVMSFGEKQRASATAYVENQKQHHLTQELNAWLERISDFDEGPEDEGLPTKGGLNAIREPEAEYNAWGEAPF